MRCDGQGWLVGRLADASNPPHTHTPPYTPAQWSRRRRGRGRRRQRRPRGAGQRPPPRPAARGRRSAWARRSAAWPGCCTAPPVVLVGVMNEKRRSVRQSGHVARPSLCQASLLAWQTNKYKTTPTPVDQPHQHQHHQKNQKKQHQKDNAPGRCRAAPRPTDPT